jgi:hypothetical protein
LNRRAAALASMLLLAASPGAAPGAPYEVRGDAIRRHMILLADDRFGGRRPGTKGYDDAAAYVASELGSAGVRPAGEHGGWMQPVPLRRGIPEPDRSYLRLRDPGAPATPRALAPRDYVLVGNPSRASALVRARVVFAGYGIVNPHTGADDYRGLDVRGAAVAVLSGAPATLPAVDRAVASDWNEKARAAASRGAVALIAVSTPSSEAFFKWSSLRRWLGRGRTGWRARDGAEGPGVRDLEAFAALSRGGGEVLFRRAPVPFDVLLARAEAGKPVAGFPLDVEVELRAASRIEEVASSNVLGVLPGADPALAGETVLLLAHLDHLGTDPAGRGDGVRNGFYDNASGVAMLLEVARALSAGPRPRRSVAFAAVTAEEWGLVGADYLAHRAGPGRVVAVLNLDMILMLQRVRDLVAYGEEHSTLGSLLRREAARLSFRVSPDPEPHEVVFIRSDHWPFVRRGVPALFVCTGLLGPDGRPSEVVPRWMEDVYHSPEDDPSQPVDEDSAARIGELHLRMLRALADGPEPPAWTAGSRFAPSPSRTHAAAAP